MREIVNVRRIVLVLVGAVVLWTAPAGAADPIRQADTPAPKAASARKRAAPAVKAPVKAGGNVEPVAGAPPPPASSTETKPMRGTVGPVPARPAQADAATGSLVAVTFAEGEATLEVAGTRQIVRAGSRLGDDTVRSVAPGRIVLERAAEKGGRGGSAFIVLTFDASGRSHAQVFWSADPTRTSAPEVKRP